MNNNDMLRRIRYIFDINDDKMIELFGNAGMEVSRSEISDWLKKEDDLNFRDIYDRQLAHFLDGFITDKRGKNEGPSPPVPKRLDNNMILRKLKIALSLKDFEILEILDKVDMHISKHELSAFFRKPGQGQYKVCKDQILRRFLQGLQIKYRPGK